MTFQFNQKSILSGNNGFSVEQKVSHSSLPMNQQLSNIQPYNYGVSSVPRIMVQPLNYPTNQYNQCNQSQQAQQAQHAPARSVGKGYNNKPKCKPLPIIPTACNSNNNIHFMDVPSKPCPSSVDQSDYTWGAACQFKFENKDKQFGDLNKNGYFDDCEYVSDKENQAPNKPSRTVNNNGNNGNNCKNPNGKGKIKGLANDSVSPLKSWDLDEVSPIKHGKGLKKHQSINNNDVYLNKNGKKVTALGCRLNNRNNNNNNNNSKKMPMQIALPLGINKPQFMYHQSL